MLRSIMSASRAILAAAISASVAGIAAADIAAFNKAWQAADFRTAAAEAKGIWPTLDKTDPDTAAVTRQFGFAALMGGDFAQAHDYGVFLKQNGASLPKPDDAPATSAVLLAAADFSVDRKTGRDALVSALKARAAKPDLDDITLKASEILYNADWSARRWANAAESGPLAAELIGRAGPAYIARKHQAALAGAAANYISSPGRDDYTRLADEHDAIVADIDAATNPNMRKALLKVMFQAQAWTMAVANSLDTVQQTGHLLAQGAKVRPLKDPKVSPFAEDASGSKPFCKGKVDIGSFSYPAAAEYRGLVGSVIVRFESDQQGRIIAAEPLASVPSDIFADALVKASGSFRWKPEKGVDLSRCTLATRAGLINFSFQME